MTKPKTFAIHFAGGTCGVVKRHAFTRDPLAVSCGSCKRTKRFRAALARIIQPTMSQPRST